MRELVFNSGTYDVLLADAVRLGFTYTDEAGETHIQTNGNMASGGNWALNIVGDVYEPVTPPANPDDPWPTPVKRPGYFGRLRLNGEESDAPTFSPEIIQYTYVANPEGDVGGWVNIADGSPAPDFVKDIGVIA